MCSISQGRVFESGRLDGGGPSIQRIGNPSGLLALLPLAHALCEHSAPKHHKYHKEGTGHHHFQKSEAGGRGGVGFPCKAIFLTRDHFCWISV